MNCLLCPKKAVINLQHGSLCKHHFLHYFEEKVFRTIKKYQLITRKDRVGVAASGGKDSQTVLYLTKKYLQKNNLPTQNLFALVIDEGIKNYRQFTIKDLEEFCRNEKIPLFKISVADEFGFTLDQAIKKMTAGITTKKPCHLCGVWRRYLLNKYARKQGATKLVTGHNLDDEAQAVIMNLFKANTSLAAHLGLISGIEEHPLFIRRVKPLYFCSEKETKLYSLLKKFPVQFKECPYAESGYRAQVREMLNNFEQGYRGTKAGIINSFLALLPILKEKEQMAQKNNPLTLCHQCGEPANQKVCHACQIKEELKKNKTRIRNDKERNKKK